MKYIQSYETLNPIKYFKDRELKKKLKLSPYKVGDYVVVDLSFGDPLKELDLKVGKIIDIKFWEQMFMFDYTIEFSDGTKKDFILDMISFEANPEEISEYELEKENPEAYQASKKYNL